MTPLQVDSFTASNVCHRAHADRSIAHPYRWQIRQSCEKSSSRWHWTQKPIVISGDGTTRSMCGHVAVALAAIEPLADVDLVVEVHELRHVVDADPLDRPLLVVMLPQHLDLAGT